MQYIHLLDYALLPFFLLLAYVITIRFRNRNYPPGHPFRPYIIPALSVKLFGSVFLGIIYAYYYGYSDSFGFFEHSQVIGSAFKESPGKWLNLVLHLPDPYDPDYYRYTSNLYWYTVDDASYIVSAVASIIGLFDFNTYLPTSIVFACISFTGVWALFRTFCSLYPRLVPQIAVCVLFVPGVVMWGSGLLKDTLCLFALGWLTYAIFRLLVQRDFRLKNVFLIVLCFFILAKVKIYILLAFLPAVGLWVLFSYVRKLSSRATRIFVNTAVLTLILGSSLFLMQKFADQLGVYSLDRISSFAAATHDWITYSTQQEEGSGYTLGDPDFSLLGMLKKFPLAVNVTLFRPYLWEARKPIVMISALESLLFLFVTLKVFYVVGWRKVWRTINADSTIQFCLIFTVIFSFAIGVTTYNFGTLSRYKIPCMPFFALALVLIYYRSDPHRKKLLPFL